MKIIVCLCLTLAFGSVVQAAEPDAPKMSPEEEAMMAAGAVGPQHQQLKQQFDGTWDTKVTMWMDPANPMTTMGQSVNSSTLDGRFIASAYTGDFMGQPFAGIGYTGYDNVRKQYVASWMDSMSTGLYVTYGDYDATSKTYTYHADMPDFMAPGKTFKVRQTVKIDNADQHTMGWFETRVDKEVKTMEIVYTRKK